MKLTDALKDDATYVLLEKISGWRMNPPVRQFLLEWRQGAKEDENKTACKLLIEGGEDVISKDTVEKLRFVTRAEAGPFESTMMPTHLALAHREATEKVQEWLNQLERSVAPVTKHNQENVKNSKDGDTLQAALVGKLLVIGSTSDLYHNHPNLASWLFGRPKATPEAKGTLKVKKGKGLSAGSLTAAGGLAAHKTIIAPRIAEFSKKKLLEG